jgi:hypothetical protein
MYAWHEDALRAGVSNDLGIVEMRQYLETYGGDVPRGSQAARLE